MREGQRTSAPAAAAPVDAAAAAAAAGAAREEVDRCEARSFAADRRDSLRRRTVI